MLTLVASVPSAIPWAAIVGILILLRKESTFFKKKKKKGRKPRCVVGLLGAPLGQSVSRSSLLCSKGTSLRAGPALPQLGGEPDSIWSGGSTHLGKLSHSSAMSLHPCPLLRPPARSWLRE